MPVVCCSLHSQVVPVCAALSGVAVAYVQVAGGALPVSLSDAVRVLRSAAAARFHGRSCAVRRRGRAGGERLLGAGVRRRRRRGRDRLRHRAGHRRHGHGVRARRPRRRPGRRRGRCARRSSRCWRRGCRRATRGHGIAGSRITRRRSSASASRPPLVPDELEPDGWRERMRGPSAVAHGPRGGRRPGLLRRGVCGGPSCEKPPDVMEERRLGPVIGLGTWRTFGGDASLARDVVDGGAGARRAADRLVADVRRRRARRSAPRSTVVAPMSSVATKIWASSVEEGREQFERAARLVRRPRRDRAGAQPRRRGASISRGSRRSGTRDGSAGSA